MSIEVKTIYNRFADNMRELFNIDVLNKKTNKKILKTDDIYLVDNQICSKLFKIDGLELSFCRIYLRLYTYNDEPPINFTFRFRFDLKIPFRNDIKYENTIKYGAKYDDSSDINTIKIAYINFMKKIDNVKYDKTFDKFNTVSLVIDDNTKETKTINTDKSSFIKEVLLYLKNNTTMDDCLICREKTIGNVVCKSNNCRNQLCLNCLVNLKNDKCLICKKNFDGRDEYSDDSDYGDDSDGEIEIY